MPPRNSDCLLRSSTAHPAGAAAVVLVPSSTYEGGTYYFEFSVLWANTSVRAHVQTTSYPPIYHSSYPYTSLVQHTRLFWSELVSVCNVNDIMGALPVGRWSTQYRVPPAMHLSDTSSIFWLGPGTDPTIDEKVATALQGYIVQFMLTGSLNGRGGLLHVLRCGEKKVLGLGSGSIAVKRDITVNESYEY